MPVYGKWTQTRVGGGAARKDGLGQEAVLSPTGRVVRLVQLELCSDSSLGKMKDYSLWPMASPGSLNPADWKRGPWAGGVGTTWELDENADSGSHPRALEPDPR